MSKRKYTKGRTIWTLDELVEQSVAYFNDKPLHWKWFKNLQLHTVLGYLCHGCVREATPVDWRLADENKAKEMPEKEVRRLGCDAGRGLRSRQQKSQ